MKTERESTKTRSPDSHSKSLQQSCIITHNIPEHAHSQVHSHVRNWPLWACAPGRARTASASWPWACTARRCPGSGTGAGASRARSRTGPAVGETPVLQCARTSVGVRSNPLIMTLHVRQLVKLANAESASQFSGRDDKWLWRSLLLTSFTLRLYFRWARDVSRILRNDHCEPIFAHRSPWKICC